MSSHYPKKHDMATESLSPTSISFNSVNYLKANTSSHDYYDDDVCVYSGELSCTRAKEGSLDHAQRIAMK